MKNLSSRTVGIIQVLLSGICFGFLGIFGKWAFERGIRPGELLSFRFLLGGVLLFVYLCFHNPKKLRVSKKEFLDCALLGIGGYAVFSSCFFEALQGLSVALTVLLLFLYPIFVSLGGWLFLGEKISREKFVAIPVSVAGLLFLIWGDFNIRHSAALWFGLGSAIFYSLYILYSSHRLKQVEPLVSVTYIQLCAGLALALVHWRDPVYIAQLFMQNFALFFAISFICSICAMGFFLAALRRLYSWEVSIFSMTEPVIDVLLAFLFLGEILKGMQWVGALLIGAGFVILAWPTRKMVAVVH